MPTFNKNSRPTMESLEERLTLSAPDTLSTLRAFTQAYLSHVGQPNYNPAFDLNHNGQIGQDDGRLLLRALAPVASKVPITLHVVLAPQDQARGPLPRNSGGVTHSKTATVLGHTSPGALIFTGNGPVDLKLRGPAYVADANGNFAIKDTLTDGINQFDIQVVDRYGQQNLRAFPIYWLDFARYENAHPK